MARIDGIREKVKRAIKHIGELDGRIKAFSADEPYTIGAKPHPVPAIEHTTLYVESIKTIPPDFSVIIGDAVHNLRSALDHLAWQLVEAGGGTPGKDTYFPICRDPNGAQKYASAIGQGEINKMLPGAHKVLREVQPCFSGDDTLWHIHELDRFDKHRVLITLGTGYGEWYLMVGGGQKITFGQWARVPLEVGRHIINLPNATYSRESHQNFKLGIDIAFGQSEVIAGKSVLETLNGMADFVNSIVGNFEPFLL